MDMHWQTWLKDRWQLIKDETRFTRRQFVVVGVLSVLMVAGGVLTARQSRLNLVVPSRPKQVTRVSAHKKPRQARTITVFVHVSGAVAQPGLYRLKPGLRTADAVAAAGGVTADGDVDALNLASSITDGQKIYVPRRGEASGNPGDAGITAGSGDKRVNLNTASAEELDGLDGIGPVLAKRIIDWRLRKGRFTSITQLDEVEGIGAKKLSLIKDHVTLE
ncbi:MAG: helix-hairpin-helix domain-containing protein [Actinomycetota bacterium]|nr:helix-hairpin-helix domain-containing protein [Actinomycetota bacterium]